MSGSFVFFLFFLTVSLFTSFSHRRQVFLQQRRTTHNVTCTFTLKHAEVYPVFRELEIRLLAKQVRSPKPRCDTRDTRVTQLISPRIFVAKHTSRRCLGGKRGSEVSREVSPDRSRLNTQERSTSQPPKTVSFPRIDLGDFPRTSTWC